MLEGTSQGSSRPFARPVPALTGVSNPDHVHGHHTQTFLSPGEACPPEAPFDEARLQADTERLQAIEDWNTHCGQTGGSFHLPHRRPPLVWTSRRQWLQQCSVALHVRPGQLFQRRRIPIVTIMAVARTCAQFADSRTGRRVTASTSTIGRLAAKLLDRDRPLSADTVRRCRAILAELGMAIECERGRYLTSAERQAATIHHGGLQNRAASVWSLVSPAAIVKICSHLPRRGLSSKFPSSTNSSPTRARTRSGAPSGRLQRKTSPPPLHAQRVAARFIEIAPGLAPRGHIGSLVKALTDHVDTHRWTAHDIIDLINRDTKHRGWTWPDTVHNPIRFLRWRLHHLHTELAGPSPSETAKARHRRDAAETRSFIARPTNTASADHRRLVIADLKATLTRHPSRK